MFQEIKQLIRSKEIWSIRAAKVIIALCAIVLLMAPAIYCFSPAWNSDLVENVLWADEAIHAGRLLNIPISYIRMQFPLVEIYSRFLL